MSYKILPYSYKQAEKLNVEIKPSTNKNKKIDVFKNNKKIASIGAIGYNDKPTFMKDKGLMYANERARLYKLRHYKDIMQKDSNGYWADKILW